VRLSGAEVSEAGDVSQGFWRSTHQNDFGIGTIGLSRSRVLGILMPGC